MTGFWFLVTATGVLIIVIGFFLTPTVYALVYIVGGALAMSGPTVALLRIIDTRTRSTN